MTDTRDITVETLHWQGLTIEVSYEPKWLGGNLTAHLQLRTLRPERAPMPISEAGYRSHFVPYGCVEAESGPLAYAEAWLNHAAKSAGWRNAEDLRRQLSHF